MQVGPAKQCRDMLAPERKAASLLYFTTLMGTLLSVFVLKVRRLEESKRERYAPVLSGVIPTTSACRAQGPAAALAALLTPAPSLGPTLSTDQVQLLSLMCVVAQFAALTWYMLSYMPYGQQCAKRVISRFL